MIKTLLRQLVLLSLVVTSVSACLAPRPKHINRAESTLESEPVQREDFISNQELKAVELATQALSYLGKGRYLDAEFALRKALYLTPNAINLRLNLILALEGQTRYEEALAELSLLSPALLSSSPLLATKARLKARNGDFKGAKAIYMQAVFLDGLNQGSVLDDSKRADLARELARLSFVYAEEELALCASNSAIFLRTDSRDLLQHLKLLNALSLVDLADRLGREFIVQNGTDLEPGILFELALSNLAKGERSVSREFFDLARFKADLSADLRWAVLPQLLLNNSSNNQPTEDQSQAPECSLEFEQALKDITIPGQLELLAVQCKLS